jgi:hypothetical protein
MGSARVPSLGTPPKHAQVAGSPGQRSAEVCFLLASEETSPERICIPLDDLMGTTYNS